MRTFVNTCGIIVLMAALLSFAMQNTHTVPIRYYGYLQVAFPAWGVVLVPFFLGAIAGNLLDVIQRFRLKRQVRQLRRELPHQSPEES